MTSADRRLARWIPLVAALAACGGSSSSSSNPPGNVDGNLPPGANVVAISVSGPGCPAGVYLNEPCVSATVCVPGTSTCQTVGGLLLDTGSTGLRVFRQALGLTLPPVASGGGDLAECVGYLDGSSQWGPVVRADVVLGGEPAVTVPIQIVDAGWSTPPSACTGAQGNPASAGFNGILGVAHFVQDCGAGCERNAANGMYYACGGGTCSGAAVPLGEQLTNPVSALPTDGNGLSVRLPAVGAGGAASASGALVLGIGTRANNGPPPAILAYPLDASGELQTTLAGATTPSFLDTGSNGYFLPSAPPGLTTCPGQSSGWFCPAFPVTLEATNTGWQGTPSAPVTFTISSIDALGPTVGVSSTIGGLSPGPSGVDWGLPFFLGREVWVGFEGRATPLGTGPYVAY